MSGTTGPEHDPGIRKAISDVMLAEHAAMPQRSLRREEALTSVYAAIADWHRREMAADTARLDWMERQDWSANGVNLGKLPLRSSVDQAMEMEARRA